MKINKKIKFCHSGNLCHSVHIFISVFFLDWRTEKTELFLRGNRWKALIFVDSFFTTFPLRGTDYVFNGLHSAIIKRAWYIAHICTIVPPKISSGISEWEFEMTVASTRMGWHCQIRHSELCFVRSTGKRSVWATGGIRFYPTPSVIAVLINMRLDRRILPY